MEDRSSRAVGELVVQAELVEEEVVSEAMAAVVQVTRLTQKCIRTNCSPPDYFQTSGRGVPS